MDRSSELIGRSRGGEATTGSHVSDPVENLAQLSIDGIYVENVIHDVA